MWPKPTIDFHQSARSVLTHIKVTECEMISTANFAEQEIKMKMPGQNSYDDAGSFPIKFGRARKNHADGIRSEDLKTALKRVRASGDHLKRFTEEFRSAGQTRNPVEAVKWSVRDHPIATIAIAAAVGTLAGRLLRPH